MEIGDGKPPCASDPVKHVVILVHGIRTHAQWMHRITPALRDAGFEVVLTNYDRMDSLKFWLCTPRIRNKVIQRVYTDIRQARQDYPEPCRLSFIAHSFGTFIVTHVLKMAFDFRAFRVLFCGSVVPYRFEFEQIRGRFEPPLINEVATKDVWSALAQSVTWRYKASGVHGFRRPRIVDRLHAGFGHGDCLTSCFCREYWIPFLKDGSLVETTVSSRVSGWARLLLTVQIKHAFTFALVILAAFGIILFLSNLEGGSSNSDLPDDPASLTGLMRANDVKWTLGVTKAYLYPSDRSEAELQLSPGDSVWVTGEFPDRDWSRIYVSGKDLFVRSDELADALPVSEVDGIYRVVSIVDVRAGPSMAHEKVHKLVYGTDVVVTGKFHDTDWLRIQVPNGVRSEGYVHLSWLKEVPFDREYRPHRTEFPVDVFSGLGINRTLVTHLEAGSDVIVTGSIEVGGQTWLRINYDGNAKGYVMVT